MKMGYDKGVELKQSPLWESVVGELVERIRSATNELKFCKPEELIAKQAKITVLEEITNLPQHVIDREHSDT